MSYRDLARHKSAVATVEDNAAGLFLDALRYGHYLWLHGNSARALLALMRALYIKTEAAFPVSGPWVLPYAAIGWIVRNHPGDSFMGNPRISFQHQATRGPALQDARRRARAWAAWAVVRTANPSLPGDHSYEFAEPDFTNIHAQLLQHGLPGEADLWQPKP